jgi:signal transduction histidine kinase
VGVIVLYEDGEVEIANQALTQMLGYVDSPVDRNIRDLIDLDDGAIRTRKGVASAQESARALLALVRQDGQEKSWSERDAIKVDGARVPVEVGIRRIDTASGPRLLALVVDVTARREIERLKQEFLSMVSHDLRTPLNSMQAFLELLADGIYGEITEAGNRKVGQLEGEVERLMRLIQQLLDLDRLESGASPLVLETVDATSLVNQALASVHGVAERRNIKLELLATPVMVKVSPDKIVQVLVNLLSNSIKFSPDNSTITVSSGPPQQSSQL